MSENPALYTNCEWKKGLGPRFSSYNPATNEVLWEGAGTSAEQVGEAIQNAKAAFKQWASLTLNARTEYLDKFIGILEQNRFNLAEIISKETGKTLWDSKSEVGSIINKIGVSLESYGRRCAGMIHDLGQARSITRHHPHGVVGILGPFNFPGHLPHGHIIPALLAGNTVVFKPSELTPLVGEKLVEIWNQVGLPKGVINLIQGGVETGQALIDHPDLNGLFFTGSLKTGKMLANHFATKFDKILALELGGNNPLIVSKVGDLEAAIFLTIKSAFLTSGQRCTCARRLIIVNSEQEDLFIRKLVENIGRIIVGAYSDVPEPYMGPVINEAHALHILDAQSELIKKGGIPLVEMRQLRPNSGFLSPGLIDVTNVQDRPDEEIFGPLLQVIRVKNFTEAIEEANRTKYGLSAGLLSDDSDEYEIFYSDIKAGVLSWNASLTGASGGAPFGGIGFSGNHRPSAYYAADYCSYPVALMEKIHVRMPLEKPPGLNIY